MKPACGRAAIVAAALIAAGAGRAIAAPDDIVARPLVLPAGGVELSGVLEVNLSTNRQQEPTSLAPDLWIGASERLTVGVVHSARALSRVDAGLGYCFRDEVHGCARAYDNVAVDARWSLVRGDLAIAARSRFVLRSFDPWKPRLGLGVLLRWRLGRFAITTDPSVSGGLANRSRGNRGAFDAPLWLTVQPIRHWAIHLRTGAHGTIETFRDAYEVPIGVGTTVSPHRLVDVAVEAGFRRLLGPLNDYKTRAAWIALTLRWP